jgi:uncharacterized protein YjbI with pentapeptide repeats
MAANLDPFDVEALEKSVNDSAVRVSTIWISFLVFGLYLAIAAGGTTDRQLFLEEPIKLPILDINLPLVGFYFLAPLLFVIFHVYVLAQVLLLARTAGAYDEAVEHAMPVAADRARIRQRLANTLFAQIFAGAPRERTGLLGGLFRLMAWATLAVAPAAVLLTFEVQFLKYHDGFVTWTHRILIAADLAAVLLLWAAALNPERDVAWRSVLKHRPALIAALGLWLTSVGIVSFPGEWHADWTRFGESAESVPSKCKLNLLLYRDRIDLWGGTLVAYKKLTRRQRGEIVEGIRFRPDSTHDFSTRDLSCGAFSRTDLRGADFSSADLRGANFLGAELEGATFELAKLENASFLAANVQEAYFFGAYLQGADLRGAKLQGANLSLAHLQGAHLNRAQLQGATLRGARLQGADLRGTQLQGADLREAELQGANLSGAGLEGANLDGAQLQGTDLTQAQLQAANLSKAELQGALLRESSLTLAAMRRAHVWRATEAQCDDAQVMEPQLDALSSTVAGIDGFVEQAVQDVPEQAKQQMKTTLHARFMSEASDDHANEQVWRACEAKALTREEWEKRHAAYLVDLACGAERQENQKYVANRIIYAWIPVEDTSINHAQALARGLLGLDGKPCPGGKELDEEAMEWLRDVVARRNPKN